MNVVQLDMPEAEARALLEHLERLARDVDCHGFAGELPIISPISALREKLAELLAEDPA